jgi:tripartite-type tricarboxylate transporter receptor subunit TctC
VVIPYKGGGPATADVLAGQVVMMFGGPSSLAQHVATGRLRAVAVTGVQRIPALPGVPTFAEAGLQGVDAGSYWGSLAPAATPREIVNTLSGAMMKVLQIPEVRQRLIGLGYEPIGSTPEQFAGNIRSEMEKWAKAVKEGKFASSDASQPTRSVCGLSCVSAKNRCTLIEFRLAQTRPPWRLTMRCDCARRRTPASSLPCRR